MAKGVTEQMSLKAGFEGGDGLQGPDGSWKLVPEKWSQSGESPISHSNQIGEGNNQKIRLTVRPEGPSLGFGENNLL